MQTEPSPSRKPAVVVAAVLLLVALAGLAGLILRTSPSPIQRMGDQPAPTELAIMDPLATLEAQATRSADPTIRTADDAIRQSLAQFPPDRQVTGTIARLLRASTLNDWRGSGSPFLEDHVPVWLVAITADGMTVADGLEFYGGRESGSEAIQGMYFAWDANGGNMLGVGTLGEQWPQNLGSLTALEQVDLPITPATPIVIPDGGSEDPGDGTAPSGG